MIHRFVDLVAGGIVPYHRQDTGAGWQQIWQVPQAGGAPVQVTTQTTTTDSDPDAAPDGSKIAFLRIVSSNARLYVVNADGSDETELDTGQCRAPMWHPDGSKILYRIGSGFFTIEPDGTNKTNVTPDDAPVGIAGVTHPTYNRDGTKIAWFADFSSGTVEDELWVCDGDGTNATFLSLATRGGRGALAPSWAHNSDTIAFVERISSNNHVSRIAADGTGKVQLTTASLLPAIRKYAWSTDDTDIFVARTASGPWNIYRVPADDSGESAISPALNGSAVVGEGIPSVHGDRLYVVRSSSLDLVSVAFDGSGLRVEDDIHSSDADVFVELTGNGTEL